MANIDVPPRVSVGAPFTVSAAGSFAPEDGDAIVEARWTFGDGGTDTGLQAQHRYSEPGTYTVGVTVVDAQGQQATATARVEVVADDQGGDGGDGGDGDSSGDDADRRTGGDRQSGGGDGGGGGDYTQPRRGDGGGDGGAATQVTVERGDGRATVTVKHARESQRVRVALGAERVRAAGVGFNAVGVELARDADFELDLRAADAAPDDAGTAAAPGFEPVAYLRVDHPTLPDAAVANATLTFTVEREKLRSLGAEAQHVSAYVRRDGEWRRLSTRDTKWTKTTVTYRADAAGLSTFTVGVHRPATRVTELQTNASTVTAGQGVAVSATVENAGLANDTRRVALALDGERVAAREVAVPAGESRTVTFAVRVDAPGDHRLAVGNATATLAVRERPAGKSDATRNAPGTAWVEKSGDATHTSQPGFSAVLALVALVAAALLALRRE